MKALVDGDVITYACGFAVQRNVYDVWTGQEWLTLTKLPEWAEEYHKYIECQPLANCLHTVKQMLSRIFRAVDATSHQIYLTGTGNFREEVDSEYKANRKDSARPFFYDDIRYYLIHNWGAKVTDGQEADDALGLAQTEDTVICSIDKDLDLVPGLHYNWKQDRLYSVNREESLETFWYQMLIGDRVDNIKGVPGIGKKKAANILDSLPLEEMHDAVLDTYMQYSPNDAEDFYNNADLLWIRQQAECPVIREKL